MNEDEDDDDLDTLDDILEDDEDEDCDDICPSCNGSGEGMYDGTRCSRCKGRGVSR